MNNQFIGYLNNEQEFLNKINNKELIEAAYFAIPTEEGNPLDIYYPSTRLENSDNKVKFLYLDSDLIKTFFGIEVMWGYYGWEWVDYEYNGEILKGGNFFNLLPTNIYRSIPDGYRLQHINNLTSLLPQYPKMLTIENFDTSNIISAEKAFNARGVWDLREETVLLLDVYDFPKLLNCYQMFYLNLGYLEFKDKNRMLTFDSILSVNSMFYNNMVYSNRVKNFPKIYFGKNVTEFIKVIDYYTHTITEENEAEIDYLKLVCHNPYFPNVNKIEYFYNTGKLKINNSSKTLDKLTVNFNLYDGEYVEGKEINVIEPGLGCSDIINKIIINVNSNNNISSTDFLTNFLKNDYDLNIDLGKVNKLNFNSGTFNVKIPVLEFNYSTDMKNMYKSCTINCPSTFDFSPNKTILNVDESTKVHVFELTKFTVNPTLLNIDCLEELYINATFPENYHFPYILELDYNNYNRKEYGLTLKNVKSIESQTLHCHEYKYREWGDPSGITCFDSCNKIDFTEHPLTIELYFDFKERPSSYSWPVHNVSLTKYCDNVVTSPIVKGTSSDMIVIGEYNISNKLVTLNYGEVHSTFTCLYINLTVNSPSLTFPSSLVYCKLGNVNNNQFNFSKCVNLDIPTFVNSFSTWLRTDRVVIINEYIRSSLTLEELDLLISKCKSVSIQ